MREPNLKIDGWCLDDGEAYHREAPDTFAIPPRVVRESLQPGDFAKLIFQISVDDPEQSTAIERMWVLVRERTPGGYLGVLDNDPPIAENDEFCRGVELPFAAKHIIDILDRDENSIALAQAKPTRRWSMQ